MTVLVAYGSTGGGTAGIAGWIADELRARRGGVRRRLAGVRHFARLFERVRRWAREIATELA